jgi:hypothetical protein
MKNEKVIFVNRSNGNKQATTNEKVKFAIVQAVKNLDLESLGIFDATELEEAARHFVKHSDAVCTKFEKSADIVKAVVKTEFTIID